MILKLILTMAVTTLCIRSLPFIIWKDANTTPKFIQFLGQQLPAAMIALLVVYCLKDTDFLSSSHGIPEIIAIILIALLQKWKHNSILSILCGTFMYMFLVQTIF